MEVGAGISIRLPEMSDGGVWGPRYLSLAHVPLDGVSEQIQVFLAYLLMQTEHFFQFAEPKGAENLSPPVLALVLVVADQGMGCLFVGDFEGR